MPLSFLSLGDIESYITIQYPDNLFPAELARMVYQRTEGNPLFMTEMLRFLREQGTLALRGGRWQLEQPATKVSQSIPVGIHSMIQLKIGRLKPEDLQILLCAAVQGVQFDSAVIAEVLSLDRADVEERLQDLDAAHNFVAAVGEQEFPNQPFSVRYRFVHVFYQDALYASLTPSRRAAYSLAAARELVRFSGEAARSIAADLAFLFEVGKDHSSAMRYFLQAAHNAARGFAYREAAVLCERGLRALANLPASRERDAQELQVTPLMVTRGYADPEVEKNILPGARPLSDIE
jgi:predicted ATPase